MSADEPGAAGAEAAAKRAHAETRAAANVDADPTDDSTDDLTGHRAADAVAADGRATHPPAASRTLSVIHETRYHYDAAVEVAHHSAWLRPRDTEDQQVIGWDLQIDPPPDSAVQQSRDAFGNWRHGFSHARVHDKLQVVSTFQAVLKPPAAIDCDISWPWPQVAQALRYRAGVQQPEAVQYMLGSHFAPHHATLARFAQPVFARRDRPLLDAAIELMALVHAHMAYKPHSTDVATDALQALQQRSGVCQDFAHLMIGALRSLGLAARYVSGYLLTQPPPGQPRLIGADASHAWVAVWCPQNGWVALDPTNNVRVGQDHVTLAWGRDYADVAPLRGVIRGGGTAPPEVAVTVAPVDEPVPSSTRLSVVASLPDEDAG